MLSSIWNYSFNLIPYKDAKKFLISRSRHATFLKVVNLIKKHIFINNNILETNLTKPNQQIRWIKQPTHIHLSFFHFIILIG